MPRRPEIGNVQLYPDRPLRKSDRNGYVLKFYCPILGKRIRRNCGTRDRREARKLQRECQERLLNGEYLASNGAISTGHVVQKPIPAACAATGDSKSEGPSWQQCYDRYLEQRRVRVRPESLVEIISRLGIAERILEAAKRDTNQPEGLLMSDVSTLDKLEYLQERLLAGDECRYDERSPNTVNSLMGAVMAFIRFCHSRGWVASVPKLERLESDEVMKGRPVTEAEFQQMLDATESVVGKGSAESWKFALRVLWESGFRIGDLMDFSWNDSRHIHPIWPTQKGQFSTVMVPSSQKNGRVQEIPMLPGLAELLEQVPVKLRTGWIVNPAGLEVELQGSEISFRPSVEDLRKLAQRYSNVAIATACGVSEAAVRKWLKRHGIQSCGSQQEHTVMTANQIERLRSRAERCLGSPIRRTENRLTKERVGRVIGLIGLEADIVVQLEDSRVQRRKKFASAHDIRRGLAQRLINAGVSAETLKVVMRHKDFATTERHYGALRSAQSAAAEISTRLAPSTENSAFVGGFVGDIKKLLRFRRKSY